MSAPVRSHLVNSSPAAAAEWLALSTTIDRLFKALMRGMIINSPALRLFHIVASALWRKPTLISTGAGGGGAGAAARISR
ncbi:hypothetical protein JQ596_06735 [Bradyrhizobium manausense]|uniref:hypothetical protein n=1 Tax=Bradyrhizobium TaxID=374 RepID=UPI001BABFCD5|nr:MULTISPECIES: hypothetical protein [Bradyrhizobium]MBR0825224.1 hypothetical protein [Bradyrhizobium manausense]UVO28412.1 hypothetical protein KUF59_39145 [Bradyrhizobium arachidis]